MWLSIKKNKNQPGRTTAKGETDTADTLAVKFRSVDIIFFNLVLPVSNDQHSSIIGSHIT